MLTKIDLCSYALLKFGEQPIQSLTDNSASAQLARTIFDPVMESLLALHPWKFATQNIELTKTEDGYFLIPSNVLRVVKSKGEIIGNKIISEDEIITISAIVKTPVENYPSYFVSLAAVKLALEFCIPLSGDQTIFRMLASLYESELRTAKFIDSTISVNNQISDFSLISARF